MARFGIVQKTAVAKQVIFSGTPSQVINVPAFAKGVVAMIIILAAYIYSIGRWPVPWFVPIAAVVIVIAGVGVAYLQTAFTEIIIDTERITRRQGILNRRVSSLELFRDSGCNVGSSLVAATVWSRRRRGDDERLEQPAVAVVRHAER